MEYAAYPMPESLPDYPSHWQIADYFDDYVDHFGLREQITLPHRGGEGGARPRAAGTTSPCGRSTPSTRAARSGTTSTSRRQRPPLGPALAGAELPGQRHLPRPAGARPLLPDARPARGQAGGGAGHRQLGDRHRGRVLAGGAGDLPGDAPRRVHRAQVHVRPADRPPHRLPARARSVRAAEAGDEADAAALGRQGHRLRPAAARPRRARGAPDRQRRPADPARARRPRGQAEHRPVRGRQGLLRRRHARSRPTSSSTAPATRCPSRSSPRRSCAPTTTT